MMGTATGLDRDRCGRKLFEERNHVPPSQLLCEERLSRRHSPHEAGKQCFDVSIPILINMIHGRSPFY